MTQAIAFPLATSVGNLESYIYSVKSFPLLSQEEEIELSTQYRQENNLEAARRLVVSHLRIVVSIARGYEGYGLPKADLIQEGNIGLMKAVKNFDPARGVRLVSYAVHWIRAEIHEYILRNWRMVRIATTKAQRKLFFNLRSMRQKLDSLTSGQRKEIAEKLGVSEKDVAEMDMRFNGHEVPLEPSTDDKEEFFAPIAHLSSGDENEPSNFLERVQEESLGSERLIDALEALDERSRRIIEARWLSNGQVATLQELADEFGVSIERIRQIEKRAMEKMKKTLTSQ